MKRYVLVYVLLGLPLVALADPYPGNQGGMQGGGMQGGMQGGMRGGMGPGMGGMHPGPPPEFMEACKGKKEGDAASVNGPHGTMQGTCQLRFVPSQRPGQQGQGGMGSGPGPGGMGGGTGQPPKK